MDLKTTRRHLLAAVRALGTADGSIEARLRAAYETALSHVAYDSGVPEPLQADFDTLIKGCEELLKQEPADQARAARLAKQVVMLYERAVKEDSKTV